MEIYFAFQRHIKDTCDQRCKHCYIFDAALEQIPRIRNDGMRVVACCIKGEGGNAE
ncbi:MAG: hypothetical protein LBB43_00640 [Spirochaetaceae bacterium]|nr:hypothetical protein [Spirochaetaceae bacterium]